MPIPVKGETIKDAILRERAERDAPQLRPFIFECHKCRGRTCWCNVNTRRVTSNWSIRGYMGEDKLPCGYTADTIMDKADAFIGATEELNF